MTKCPHCSRAGFDGRHCGACGCRAAVNPATGRTVYMIRGRLVAAPDDLHEQLRQHNARHGLPPPADPDPLDLSDE